MEYPEPTIAEKRKACMDKLKNLETALLAWQHYLSKPEGLETIDCMKHQKVMAGVWFCMQERAWIERLMKEL